LAEKGIALCGSELDIINQKDIRKAKTSFATSEKLLLLKKFLSQK